MSVTTVGSRRRSSTSQANSKAFTLALNVQLILFIDIPSHNAKVANGSLSEQAGLQASDIIVKINGRETEAMRHKEAQDAIAQAGNYLELYVERYGCVLALAWAINQTLNKHSIWVSPKHRGAINTWRPSVTPVGDLHAGEGQVYTKTSLEHSPQVSTDDNH